MFAERADITAAIAGAELVAGDPATVCRDFAVDSRKVVPGSAFVAFVGEEADGNDFVPSALKAGAACIVMTREPDDRELALAAEHGAAVLRAAGDDATAFLQALARDFRLKHDWLVVGVTGSVGKTTTKELLAAALSTRWRVHKNEGNLNSVIGVPLTVLAAPEDTQVFVCEMGMNHVGEIDAIASVAAPRLAIVTNIGTAHIGLLGSQEAIAAAKAEVAPHLAASRDLPCPVDVAPALVMLSSDTFTPYIEAEFAAPAGVPVVTAGTQPTDLVRLDSVALDSHGHPSFEFSVAEKTYATQLRLTGRHVVSDYLLVVCACELVGADIPSVVEALSAFEPPRMRQEVLASERGFSVIDDSYNASPASVAAALDVLQSLEVAGRRIAVLGEVGELGDSARELHAMMGAYAAARPLDLVVFVGGPNADEMARAASIMGMSEDVVVRARTAEEAADLLAPVLAAGDMVLAKGSRSVGLDRFVKAVL